MSIASVTATPAFPQNASGIQPVAVKAGETAPTGQAQTEHRAHGHRAAPSDSTTSSQAAAGTARSTASLNQVV
jgi:hypothetical protein